MYKGGILVQYLVIENMYKTGIIKFKKIVTISSSVLFEFHVFFFFSHSSLIALYCDKVNQFSYIDRE